METETFGHYRVFRRADGAFWELGRGAMAVTYKAFDMNLDCPVALKVVDARRLEDEHTRARFVREARAAAGLRHRNIATVYHLGQDGQSYFYAMEFVDGETVEDLVARRGPLPAAEALDIAAQVTRALGAAAKQGLVHRDIKPANLMVIREEDEDNALLVKVIDFGLARRGVTDKAAQITLGGFVGTPQYASPEQIEERDLDSRSDIYSLGVTLWFLLAGRPTFGGPAAQVGSQHLHDEPPWGTVAHLPSPVRALLARALQKNPADRPQDPGAFRREIEACRQALANGVAATDTPSAPPTFPAADLAAAETVAPGAPLPAPEGAPPTAGDVLAGRFTLERTVGEGRAGQTFRAADGRHGGRAVAVKVLRADAGLDRTEIAALREGTGRLRAAPHPRLVETVAFDETRGYWFAASEWVQGFTLVDLLRHRGRLEPSEALGLLVQAADAAVHARANGLRRLELTPHQVLIGFPGVFEDGPAREARTILDRPLARWPRFGLKIDALALPHGRIGGAAVDAGSLTVVPAANVIPEPMDGYVHALGTLLYELLSGTPPSGEPGGKRETPPLPTLGEEANALLQRALAPRPDFRSEREFVDALLTACHVAPGDLRPGTEPPPVPVPGALPMAPTIRTTLLRPPTTTVRANSPLPRHAGWLVIILVTVLIALAAGTILLLRLARP